jgi:hypothetical protein
MRRPDCLEGDRHYADRADLSGRYAATARRAEPPSRSCQRILGRCGRRAERRTHTHSTPYESEKTIPTIPIIPKEHCSLVRPVDSPRGSSMCMHDCGGRRRAVESAFGEVGNVGIDFPVCPRRGCICRLRHARHTGSPMRRYDSSSSATTSGSLTGLPIAFASLLRVAGSKTGRLHGFLVGALRSGPPSPSGVPETSIQ